MLATDYLRVAGETIGKRANERDKKGGERSMKAAINAFNSLTGHELSESQGWLFMAILKISRSQGGRFIQDDYIDGSAYFGLAGEAAEKENATGRAIIPEQSA